MNCYNGEKFINNNINSIINQTYQNWELIIWDNQSTDNSALVIADFLSDERMKVFSYDGHGVCWTPYFPQSIINYSGASGHDFVYVQTSRGFKDGNDWVLNGRNNSF